MIKMTVESSLIAAIQKRKAAQANENASKPAGGSKPLNETDENLDEKSKKPKKKNENFPGEEEGDDIDIPEGDEDLQTEAAKKKSASELIAQRKAAKRRAAGKFDRSRSRAIKKALAKIPKGVLAKRGKLAAKARKRLYGESLEESISILSGLKAGDVLTNEQLKTIRSGLMDHLYESISAGESRGEVYQRILHDIAPLMQIVESINAREDAKVEEKDIPIMESYVTFMDSMNESSEDDPQDE